MTDDNDSESSDGAENGKLDKIVDVILEVLDLI
jgi:hypothetical protein